MEGLEVREGPGESGRVREGPGGSEGLKWSGRVQLGQMRVLDCLEHSEWSSRFLEGLGRAGRVREGPGVSMRVRKGAKYTLAKFTFI